MMQQLVFVEPVGQLCFHNDFEAFLTNDGVGDAVLVFFLNLEGNLRLKGIGGVRVAELFEKKENRSGEYWYSRDNNSMVLAVETFSFV